VAELKTIKEQLDAAKKDADKDKKSLASLKAQSTALTKEKET
jgi:hypothetical protein